MLTDRYIQLKIKNDMHVLMSGPTATNVFKLYSAPFSTQILERQVHEFEFSELSQKH